MKCSLFVCVSYIVLCQFVVTRGLPCYPGWTLLGDFCYYISDEKANWIHARQRCLEMEAHLVTISSQKESDDVNTIITDQEERVWIGLTDYLDEKNFRWDDGTELIYTNWAQGEPNNFNSEHCGVIYKNQWNDFACDWNFKYICEKKRGKGCYYTKLEESLCNVLMCNDLIVDFTADDNTQENEPSKDLQERLQVYSLTKELLQSMRGVMDNLQFVPPPPLPPPYMMREPHPLTRPPLLISPREAYYRPPPPLTQRRRDPHSRSPVLPSRHDTQDDPEAPRFDFSIFD